MEIAVDSPQVTGNEIAYRLHVSKALRKFKGSEEHQASARKWVDWYWEHKTDRLSGPEAKQRMEAAIKNLPTTTNDEQHDEVWEEIKKVLRDWLRQF